MHLLDQRTIRQRRLDEELVREPIRKCVQQVAVAVQAIATCTSCLLIVRLQRTRHRVVNHESHVRLVHAHAEAVRRDDDTRALGHEVVLHAPTPLVIEAGVVRTGRNALIVEILREALDGLARRRVHDARAILQRAQQIHDDCVLLAVALCGDHAVRQVRTIESRDDDLGVLQVQNARDVLSHHGRRRGGERDRGRIAEPLTHFADAAITGAEVVAPFADAVRLVDSEHRNTDCLQPLRCRTDIESLRRDVQHLDVAALRPHHAVTHLGAAQRAVDERRGNAAALERVDLVLHERDQRRDDHREPARDQRRHLVAERLAAAGREHDERIAASDDALNRAFLPGTERAIAEPRLQHGAGIINRGSTQHSAGRRR